MHLDGRGGPTASTRGDGCYISTRRVRRPRACEPVPAEATCHENELPAEVTDFRSFTA
jgi:hypothetical protein